MGSSKENIMNRSSASAGEKKDAARGDAVHGDAASGDAVHGDTARGDAVHGDAARGDVVHGDAARGDAVHGDTAYQRLKFLLEQTTTYSKFLGEKIAKGTEANLPAKRKKQASSCAFSQPTTMTGGTLKRYQLQGAEWLVSLYENGMNGILADEMGLGKTVESIAFLAFLRQQGVWGPFLIVAPLSTLANWQAEIERWVPSMPVLLYHGDPKHRASLRSLHFSHIDPNAFPVIVTSYDITMRDRRYFKAITWKLLLVDEGHRIKNLNCKLIRDLKTLKSENRLLLTGTPLQNNLAELWSLLNFLLPDIFDDLESFQSWFDLSDLDNVHILDKEAQQCILSNLHTILKPFLLRRLKCDVEQELCPKKEFLLFAPLARPQFDLCQAILNGTIRAHVSRLDEEKPTDNKHSSAPSSVGCSQNLQNTLMQLRKACNHPFLFYHPANTSAADESIVTSSGKMLLLDQLLNELIRRGHKTLIFSQMSRMLDILEDYLVLRRIKYCRIDGSVPQAERVVQIKTFDREKSVRVFLLTTRAGGLGINLVSADTVIFYDSDWNPQMDLQAQDRTHRIGQTRPVSVYRLITENSVEGHMLERASSKRLLERLVIHKKKFKGGRQYYLNEDHTLLDDLRAVLDDPPSSTVLADSVLSKADLDCVLDRSLSSQSSATNPSAFKLVTNQQAIQ